MSETHQIAVVGGGIAGLTAALEAARAGASVVLFERSGEIGGRAASRDLDGYVFNQGPHALYRRGEFRRVLAAHGVEFRGAPPVFHATAIWSERLYPLPRDLGSILRGAPLSLTERVRLLTLFRALPKLDLGPWRGRAFAEFTQPMPPRLRALFHALARLSTYAQAPERLDAAATLAQLRLAIAGVLYVDGGWSSLVEGMAAAARRAGAQIRLAAPVERLEARDGGWRVGDVRADAVVLATPPTAAAALLPSSQALAEAVRAAVPARAVSLDFGLRRLPRPEAAFALGIEAPLYFSVHSVSARLAPQGGALLHAARYLGPEESVDAAKVEEVLALVERLQPGYEAEVAQSSRILGLAVAYDTPRPERGGRMAPLALADAPGVFLAGDWVGEGAMLSDAAAKSGREAAALALARPRAAYFSTKAFSMT